MRICFTLKGVFRVARVLTCGCFPEESKFAVSQGFGHRDFEPLYCPMCGKKSEDREKHLRRKREEEAAKARMTKLF